MKSASLLLATAVILSLATASRPSAAEERNGGTVTVGFSNPGLSPSHWTLSLNRDGSGHFRSEPVQVRPASSEAMEVGAIDRDVQVSREFAARVFATAERRKWFSAPCESHLKVAFQGWKTLGYTGPEGQGSCTFNYSTDKEIQSLGDDLQAVAATVIEGARLEMLLQHDRLGLDREMEFLVGAAHDGRARQLGAIRGILEKLAGDESVLERVRKRARQLLKEDM
jgi:hypothetical protein